MLFSSRECRAPQSLSLVVRRLRVLAPLCRAEYRLSMKTVTLSARFDGNRIQLDEPFPLPVDARLLITVMPDLATEAERQEWHAFSKASLARAYSDDEPDYPASLVRTPTIK